MTFFRDFSHPEITYFPDIGTYFIKIGAITP
jgi:hypothetical protein